MPNYHEKAPLWVSVIANAIALLIGFAGFGIQLYGYSHNALFYIFVGLPFLAVPALIEMWLEKKYTSPENYQRYKDALVVANMKVLKYTILLPFYIIIIAYMVFFHKTFK